MTAQAPDRPSEDPEAFKHRRWLVCPYPDCEADVVEFDVRECHERIVVCASPDHPTVALRVFYNGALIRLWKG